MKKAEYRKLPLGLYRLHWKSGGSSLAAVGMTESGQRWMAPVNWTAPPEQKECWRWWRQVELATLLTPYASIVEKTKVGAG